MKKLTLSLIVILISTFAMAGEVLYEINTRQFSPEGTFHQVEQDLPRLHKLGVSILWFMPVHAIGEVHRKGSLGSPYSVKDYRSINPEYGTKIDFKRIVEKAHRLGMKVIIDWVANHTAFDHHWMTTNPEFYTRNAHGHVIPPSPDWDDVADLDYSKPGLWHAMIEDMKYWIREFNIDGFRCDVASMVPEAFWVKARRELNKIKNVFMLAESDQTSLIDRGAFEAVYADHLYKAFYEVIAKRIKPEAIHHVLYNRLRRSTPNSRVFMNFSTNHDKNTWVSPLPHLAGKAEQAFIALTFLAPGIPLVYGGQEFGLAHALEFFEKDLIPRRPHYNYTLISKLAWLKRTHPALSDRYGDFRALYTTYYQDPDILMFSRQYGEHTVFVMINLSPRAREFQIYSTEKHRALPTEEFQDLFTGNKVRFQAGDRHHLMPWGYRVFYR